MTGYLPRKGTAASRVRVEILVTQEKSTPKRTVFANTKKKEVCCTESRSIVVGCVWINIGRDYRYIVNKGTGMMGVIVISSLS